MSLRGARGVLVVSQNRDCELLTAIVVERTEDVLFYELLTGAPYRGEIGERKSTLRKGKQYEAALNAGGAARLRRALGPVYGYDPAAMRVFDFKTVRWPDPQGLNEARLAVMRQIWDDLSRGLPVPHLLLQPQLSIRIGEDVRYITPDYLVLNPGPNMYEAGEVKSFIVRDRQVDSASMERARLQAAVEVVALRSEAGTFPALRSQVRDCAVFIFASPWGLTPAGPFKEDLSGEVADVRRALGNMERVSRKLGRLRAGGAGASGTARGQAEAELHRQVPLYLRPRTPLQSARTVARAGAWRCRRKSAGCGYRAAQNRRASQGSAARHPRRGRTRGQVGGSPQHLGASGYSLAKGNLIWSSWKSLQEHWHGGGAGLYR